MDQALFDGIELPPLLETLKGFIDVHHGEVYELPYNMIFNYNFNHIEQQDSGGKRTYDGLNVLLKLDKQKGRY